MSKERLVQMQISLSTAEVEKCYFSKEAKFENNFHVGIGERTLASGVYRVIDGNLHRISAGTSPFLIRESNK